MDLYRITQASFGIATFSFTMALISPFVCGRRNHHNSCSHNNSSYSTESNYKEKARLLTTLADTDKNKVLNDTEQARMYKMCSVADKPAGYALTLKDLNRGIENYLDE